MSILPPSITSVPTTTTTTEEKKIQAFQPLTKNMALKEKRRAKRQRQALNRKRRKEEVADAEKREKEALKNRLRAKMNGLSSQRKNNTRYQRAAVQKQFGKGLSGIRSLFSNLGITDPNSQRKILDMVASGQITRDNAVDVITSMLSKSLI